MLEKILVCLDGSELAERVIPYITKDAAALKSRMVLLRVVPLPQSRVPLNIPGSPALPVITKGALERNADEEKEAAVYLKKKAAALKRKGLDVEQMVRTGTAGDVIVNYATENGFTLIVMATHGHGGLRRLALGSTADYVVHRATVPVLVVR